MDRLTPAQRSEMMSRIRGRDTSPERLVRSALHRAGLRFRLQRRNLPGRPDIVLPKYRSAVFVHGCFWHRHQNCPLAYVPKTRQAFWQQKFDGNRARDERAARALKEAGWRVFVVWECDLRTAARRERVLSDLVTQIRSL